MKKHYLKKIAKRRTCNGCDSKRVLHKFNIDPDGFCDHCYESFICMKCCFAKERCECKRIQNRKYRQNVTSSMIALSTATSEREIRCIKSFSCFRTHGSKYVVIPNYFTPLECDALKNSISTDSEDMEEINFNNGILRFQSTVGLVQNSTNGINQAKKKKQKSKIPDHIIRFLQMILRVHSSISLCEVKLLKSEAGCPEQDLHYDAPGMPYDENNCPFHNCPLSCWIVLEPTENPTRIKFDLSDTGNVPVERRFTQGSVIFYRGDTLHGGSSYQQTNIRGFVGMETHAYPNPDKEVGIYPKNATTTSSAEEYL